MNLGALKNELDRAMTQRAKKMGHRGILHALSSNPTAHQTSCRLNT
jgi:hypothetical protein